MYHNHNVYLVHGNLFQVEMSRVEDPQFRVAVIVAAKRAPWISPLLESSLTFSVALSLNKIKSFAFGDAFLYKQFSITADPVTMCTGALGSSYGELVPPQT